MRPEELLEVEPAGIWRETWRQLARGARDRRHAFHLPVVATRCPERGVRARTVVLRACDADAATLRLHTDRRSGKLAGVELEPRVSWCFYDPRHRVQVRAETEARVHSGDEHARSAWQRSGESARRLYRVAAAPGSRLEEPAGFEPDASEEAGFEHFAVVECRVCELDWLLLSQPRHRRLRFAPAGEGWAGTEVVP